MTIMSMHFAKRKKNAGGEILAAFRVRGRNATSRAGAEIESHESRIHSSLPAHTHPPTRPLVVPLPRAQYFNAFVNKCPSSMEDGVQYTDDNDEIGLADLEHIMTMMGDRLDTTEWANLQAKAREFVVPGTDRVNYRRLIMAIV
jgi:hypothetical protein